MLHASGRINNSKNFFSINDKRLARIYTTTHTVGQALLSQAHLRIENREKLLAWLVFGHFLTYCLSIEGGLPRQERRTLR